MPHVTLKAIANNAEVDVIWEEFQAKLEPLRKALNEKTGLAMAEWEIPREPGAPWPEEAVKQHERFHRVKTAATKQKAVDAINKALGRDYAPHNLPDAPVDAWKDDGVLDLHRQWWELRVERQTEDRRQHRPQRGLRNALRQAVRRRLRRCGWPDRSLWRVSLRTARWAWTRTTS